MLVFFEEHQYPKELISKYFTKEESENRHIQFQYGTDGRLVRRIGYLFVSGELYNGPVFLLPKTFLQSDATDPDYKDTLLGMPGIVPEGIVDTEDPENILAAQGRETFLPELSL